MSWSGIVVHVLVRTASRYRLPTASCQLVYNPLVIALAKAAMNVATWLFIVGILGSFIVVLISFFEDLTELTGKD